MWVFFTKPNCGIEAQKNWTSLSNKPPPLPPRTSAAVEVQKFLIIILLNAVYALNLLFYCSISLWMGDRQISTQVRELIKCIFQFIFYYTQVRVVNCSVRVPRVLCVGITRASSVFNAAVHESGTVVFEEKLSTDYLRLVWSKFRQR